MRSRAMPRALFPRKTHQRRTLLLRSQSNLYNLRSQSNLYNLRSQSNLRLNRQSSLPRWHPRPSNWLLLSPL